MLLKHSLFTLGVLFLSLAASAAPRSGMILHGGNIYSADATQPHPEAVGVANGKIVIVGDYAVVAKAMGPSATRLDLQGKFLMPGLIDTHVHTGFAGFQSMTEAFPDTLGTAEQIRDFVRQKQNSPKLRLGNILYFSNVSLSYWESLEPIRQVFNSPEFATVPVVLAGADAHTGWVNQAMLKQAGIDQKRLAKLGPSVASHFGQTPQGELNGFVSEAGWDQILQAMPPLDTKTMARAIVSGARELNRYGITAWMDPITNIRPASAVFSAAPTARDQGQLPAYAYLAQQGRLNGHVTALALVGIHSGPEIIQDVMKLKRRFSGGRLNLGGIKILQDGVIEAPSQSAKLSQPYLNRPDYSGSQDLNQQRFNELIAAADRQHLIAHFHTIGDRAADEALTALAYARARNPEGRTLHSLTHLEVVADRHIQQFKQLNVAASMQFLWSGKDAASTSLLADVNPALRQKLYPAGSLIRSGAIVAGASDWPVSTPNPFHAMYTGITRQGELGELPPAEEKISRQDALQAYTLNAAKVIGLDQQIGSITAGKSADFALIDRNLEKVPVAQLKDAKVLWTMLAGKVIYQQIAGQPK